jgi:hypothetical protein
MAEMQPIGEWARKEALEQGLCRLARRADIEEYGEQ